MRFFTPIGLQNLVTIAQNAQFLFTPWMKSAYGELGQSEVAGAKANPKILKYFKTTTRTPINNN